MSGIDEALAVLDQDDDVMGSSNAASVRDLAWRANAALAELQASHYRRPFTVRSDYCHENGLIRMCEGRGDPACSEKCFTDTTICNGCGTQDECRYASVIALLSGSAPTVQETK